MKRENGDDINDDEAYNTSQNEWVSFALFCLNRKKNEQSKFLH